MTKLFQEQETDQSELLQKAKKAKSASAILAKSTTKQKNHALRSISAQLLEEQTYILTENNKDIEVGRQNDMSESLIDRLKLDESRITDMADALIQLTKLTDPVGEVLEKWERPNGLTMSKSACL